MTFTNKLNEIDRKEDYSILFTYSQGADSRKRILKSLLSGSKNCSQIATDLNLNWRTVNRHLQILLREALVKSLGCGQRKFYKLTHKGEEAIRDFDQEENADQDET